MNEFLDPHLSALVTRQKVKTGAKGTTAASKLYSECKYEQALVELVKEKVTEEQRWGIVSCEILTKQFSKALVTLMSIKDFSGSAKDVLHKRTWFLHYSLFILFSQNISFEEELTLLKVHLEWINVIETTCRWLLPYTAVMLSRHKLTNLDFEKRLEFEKGFYQDSVTRLTAFEISLDFKQASLDLAALDNLDKDYFLAPFKAEFKEACRSRIFDVYCKVHSQVKYKAIEKLLLLDQPKVWMEKHASARKECAFGKEEMTVSLLVKDAYEQFEKKKSQIEARVVQV